MPRKILGKRTVVFNYGDNLYGYCVFIALMVAVGGNMSQRKGMLYVSVVVVVSMVVMDG